MKAIKCSDLGTGMCSYEATGYSDEEVINKIYTHARKAHPEKLEKMTPEEDKIMREKMHEMLKHQKA